jgi:hypothetical protein
MDGKLTETGTNTLDYYDKTTITAVKRFEVSTDIFFALFSLPVPVVAAGLEPTTFGL